MGFNWSTKSSDNWVPILILGSECGTVRLGEDTSLQVMGSNYRTSSTYSSPKPCTNEQIVAVAQKEPDFMAR
jgi:hypothetical protein